MLEYAITLAIVGTAACFAVARLCWRKNTGCGCGCGDASACACSRAVSLRSLREGQCATIAGISAEAEMGRRIRDMGLIPGAKIQVVGKAPLHDPVALRLMGFTLTLRNREADFVTVIPEELES